MEIGGAFKFFEKPIIFVKWEESVFRHSQKGKQRSKVGLFKHQLQLFSFFHQLIKEALRNSGQMHISVGLFDPSC